MEYTCALIKVDCLAACIALKVIGAVFVIFLWRWRTIYTVLQQMGSKDRYLKKCPKHRWPIRIKETCTKYTPLTLLSQRKLALTARIHFLAYTVKSLKQLKNLKNGLVHCLGLELTIHVIKNPSRETVPLNSPRLSCRPVDRQRAKWAPGSGWARHSRPDCSGPSPWYPAP